MAASIQKWHGAAEAVGLRSTRVTAAEKAFDTALNLPKNSASVVNNGEFYENLLILARAGKPSDARDILLALLDGPHYFDFLGAPGLIGTIRVCRALGISSEFSRRFVDKAPRLVTITVEAIIPMFEVFAIGLPRAHLDTVLIACSSSCVREGKRRHVYRLFEVIKRFGTAEALIQALSLVSEDDKLSEITEEKDFRAIVGEGLFDRSDLDFALGPNRSLNRDTFVSAAPLLLRIVDAIGRGDCTAVVQLLATYFAHQAPVLPLIQELRILSCELSALKVAERVRYPTAYATESECRILATLFEDRAALELFGGDLLLADKTSTEPEGVVAATYYRDYVPLARAFSRWSEPQGIATLTFGGEDLTSFFSHIAGQQLPEARIADSGRVSVLLTVYNPDLTLLELSIQSVLRQTYANIEILLIDDASDLVDSANIAALAELDPRIIYERMDWNSGPYACRNRALTLATGDFIAIQDAGQSPLALSLCYTDEN